MPHLLQLVILILAALGFIAISGYLDYNSTMAGIKRGTAHEANGVMAYMQA